MQSTCFIRAKDLRSYSQYMSVFVPAMIILSETDSNPSGVDNWRQELCKCIASWQRVNQPRTPFLTVLGDLQFIAERARYIEAQALQIPFAKTA